MKRSDLEHIIRAAGAIAGDPQIVVIGSQAILGQFPDAPVLLLRSMEADVFPRTHPELSEVIDGAIGEGSSFHESFGYYAQGVDENTAVLPAGWADRLVPIANPNTNGITGLCLEVHDLAISKYAAGRHKDAEFNRELAKHGMTDARVLLNRLKASHLPAAARALIRARIERDFPDAKRPDGKRHAKPSLGRRRPP